MWKRKRTLARVQHIKEQWKTKWAIKKKRSLLRYIWSFWSMRYPFIRNHKLWFTIHVEPFQTKHSTHWNLALNHPQLWQKKIKRKENKTTQQMVLFYKWNKNQNENRTHVKEWARDVTMIRLYSWSTQKFERCDAMWIWKHRKITFRIINFNHQINKTKQNH